MKVHTFFIRITKFCRGSFLIFRLLQPQFVVSFVHISVRGLKGEIKTKRQGIWKQCWLSVFWGTFIQDYWLLCILSSLATLVHRLQRSIFRLPNVFTTRFNKVSTRNIFTFYQPQPELVLKLFLIFGQS